MRECYIPGLPLSLKGITFGSQFHASHCFRREANKSSKNAISQCRLAYSRLKSYNIYHSESSTTPPTPPTLKEKEKKKERERERERESSFSAVTETHPVGNSRPLSNRSPHKK
jgi:hypothetical protein